jgi:hypothetical protein
MSWGVHWPLQRFGQLVDVHILWLRDVELRNLLPSQPRMGMFHLPVSARGTMFLQSSTQSARPQKCSKIDKINIKSFNFCWCARNWTIFDIDALILFKHWLCKIVRHLEWSMIVVFVLFVNCAEFVHHDPLHFQTPMRWIEKVQFNRLLITYIASGVLWDDCAHIVSGQTVGEKKSIPYQPKKNAACQEQNRHVFKATRHDNAQADIISNIIIFLSEPKSTKRRDLF